MGRAQLNPSWQTVALDTLNNCRTNLTGGNHGLEQLFQTAISDITEIIEQWRFSKTDKIIPDHSDYVDVVTRCRGLESVRRLEACRLGDLRETRVNIDLNDFATWMEDILHQIARLKRKSIVRRNMDKRSAYKASATTPSRPGSTAPGRSTPTKTPRMTTSSSEESVSPPRRYSASGSAFSPPRLSHSSEDSLVKPLSRLDRLTTAPRFGAYSRPFTPVNFEAGSPSADGLQALDPGYLGDLSDSFRVRSESPASQPLGTAFPYRSSMASERAPSSATPLSPVPRSMFRHAMPTATLSPSPTPILSRPISVISQKGHPPLATAPTVSGIESTAHTVPSEVRQTRRRSPEYESNDGRVTTGKRTKRQRSLPPPPPEHAAEDTLAWTLSTWLKNKLISPDRVIAEAMKFQVDILERTPAGIWRADVANAGYADAMQDIVHPATPDSSERPASMALGDKGSNVVDIRLTDDVQNITGPPISEQLTSMEDVRRGEPMQKSRSSILDRPRTPESTLDNPLSSIELGPIPGQDATVTDSPNEFPPRSPPVQVKQEPRDDDFPVRVPPEVGDRFGDFLVVQDGDRMVISLDEAEAFASGDESDGAVEVSGIERKRKTTLSNWSRGLNETDPMLEKTLFGRPENKAMEALEDEEEDDDIFLKDDTYGVGATDDSTLSTPELLRMKLRKAELKGVQFEHLELRDQWDNHYDPRFNPGICLTPPQKLGVFFLHLCSIKFGYALLGDEMGYGKTLMILSFIWGRINGAKGGDQPNNRDYTRWTNVVVVPASLESNWINECSKFFPSDELVAKKWTADAWRRDTSMSTVWIIRDSIMTSRTFDILKSLNHPSVCLLSLFCDEGHIALRSLDSTRAKIFHEIAKFSYFVCLASGTLFPLGPKHDGIKILLSAGGDCVNPASKHKWDNKRAAVIRRLNSRGGWNIFKFRKLITEFYLCRTGTSRWGKDLIISNQLANPIPQYIDPRDEEYEKELMVEFYKTKVERKLDGMVDMNKLRLRTDELFLLAWSPIYKEIEHEMTSYQVQCVIAEKLSSTRRTGRMAELMKALLRLKEAGHRWIIVADRVFLLALAVYICEEELGMDVGVLCGTPLYGHGVSQAYRDSVIKRLNDGELDGLIMGQRVGGCGHNFIGANYMFFMGSLYSLSYEQQCTARISRKGQTKECRAHLIGNPNFLGDSVPITLKHNRGEGEAELRRRLTDGEYRAYDNIEEFANPKPGASILLPLEVLDD